MLDLVGEHSAVVCMLANRRPLAAIRSMFGVSTKPPNDDNCPYPTSSRTTNMTFGDPSRLRLGAGQAGSDSATVRATFPGNGCPCSYSLIDIPYSVPASARE